MKLTIVLTSVLLASLACGTAMGAGPQPGDVQVTDPAQLIEMGFDPATDDVWIAPETQYSRWQDQPLSVGSISPAATDSTTPPNYVTVAGPDFHFRGQTATYTHNYNYVLSCDAGSPVKTADAAIELPNDRRLMGIWVHADDRSATAGVETTLWEICQNIFDPSRRTVVQQAILDTGAASTYPPGYWGVDLVSGSRYTENAICAYMVRATFSSCASNVSLQNASVAWYEN